MNNTIGFLCHVHLHLSSSLQISLQAVMTLTNGLRYAMRIKYKQMQNTRNTARNLYPRVNFFKQKEHDY